MRGYRRSLAKVFYSRSSVSNDLFELYGTDKSVLEADQAIGNSSCPSWCSALEAFSSEAYFNPYHISPEVRRTALQSLCSIAKEHKSIKFRRNDHLWLSALHIFQFQNPFTHSLWQNRFYCAFILYRQQRFFDCFYFSRNELHDRARAELKVIFNGGIGTNELCFCLNFFSVYFMSALRSRNNISSNELMCFKETLRAAKALVSEGFQSKEDLQRVIESSRLAIWSLDWAFHEEKICTNAPFYPHEWASISPPSIRETVFSQVVCKNKVKVLQNLADVSPWMLHQAITDRRRSYSDLQKCFAFARKAERANFLFTIYDLALNCGTVLLQRHLLSANSNVLSFLGSSLPPKLIAASGNTRAGYKEALNLLTEMCGSEVYEGLRTVFFHRPPSEQRLHQEKNGDLLAHSHPDGKTWIVALQTFQRGMHPSDDSWHLKLPHTLRLLSDAGKVRLFFQLLANYDRTKSSFSNLTVASSLAQVIRRSGTWWHAMCVLDLISTSSPPRDEQQEFFLRDACLQTLFALRSARKWEEALRFFSSLRPVMPPQGIRWMISILSDLPSCAPWREILRAFQKDCEIPETFLTTLRCVHGGEDLPSDSHGRQHAIRCLVNHGQWEKLLAMQKSAVGNITWNLIFRAAQRSSSPIPKDFFSRIPLEAFKADDALQLSFIIGHENGIVPSFLQKLNSLGFDKTSEWYQIAELFVTRISKSRYWVSSIGGLRRFAEIVRGEHEIYFQTSEEDLHRGEFIHSTCGVPRSFFLERIDQKKPTLLLRTPNGSHVNTELICYSDKDIILASKPYGVDTYSFGMGVLATVHPSFCYTCPMDIPSSAAGIVPLLSPHLPTKWCWVNFTVLLHVVPILVGSSKSSHTPILACNFMALYQGKIHLVRRHDCLYPIIIELRYEGSLSHMRESLDQMRRAMNAEGWEISQEFHENDDRGISFIINQLTVHYLTESFDKKVVEARLQWTLTPSKT